MTTHTDRVRRRVRVARSTLVRVDRQRERHAVEYSRSTTPVQRLAAVVLALRSAAAPGRHQPDQPAVDRRVDDLAAYAHELLEELWAAQQAAAEKTIRDDERRIARADRRRERRRRERGTEQDTVTDPEIAGRAGCSAR